MKKDFKITLVEKPPKRLTGFYDEENGVLIIDIGRLNRDKLLLIERKKK